ncbi:MAG: PspA/IM30 family protein [Anaerolineae bacterium]|nr:PspA/IM30 family protein [Anaerolineae bacterium]
MPNLIDKLNLLVRSSLNSVLSDTPHRADESQLPKVPAARLGKDIDKEIAELRRRIDAALSEEDAMQGRIDQLLQQIAAYDQQADDALQRGDEANARYLVQQMQRQQNLAGMMQAELEQHRRSTSDFIQRVNTLEAIVADARREQQAAPQPAPETQESQADQAPIVSLSNLLREARERVESALSSGDPAHHIPITIEPSESAAPAAAPKDIPVTTNDTPNDAQVDDDLAKRRSRLSKPDAPPDQKPDSKPG